VSARQRILEAAIKLFQERGFHGAGVSEILEVAEAPKGSLYHHFPAGKVELALAALEAVAADYDVWFTQRRARAVSGANIVRKLAAAQASWLEHTRWREGSLFSVLAQGSLPDAPELRAALARLNERRRRQLEAALREDGARDCAGLAALALAALDGGMIQAAAARDAKPLQLAADRAARAIEADLRRT
jgi:TetR/AcrR family transcriptional regulator, lmrAB and yxaGH operons repressor